MKTAIRKFGNSKGTIIPAALLRELQLDINDEVDAKVENGRIVIEPVHKVEYSLDQLLAQCSPEKMALDEDDKAWLDDAPVGKEVV
ncbi:AbrB/MazE/SpoVT family DNA-binding domain-containing protein [Idiomarina abyssalis]|uniref:AbrB/MazE/SpoVT family DNA-binding domain-containing protein n=1 Tax=Idiomarina abyssalis TaxID=86102 RepID=A0A8I1G6Z7_9GAMM|nr:AbrB/MazE/SpoVT family DNA-binding domain-containing protein [Idiomarina abyssalis]MBJ7267761.1 AbrB/MazE/SpoVT family DNA-binding domain-containing protein [Idiomarina abyssalis]MBJ7316929.1 AbrB/MazE/SpoVT family DNA-binding domain-containing protein [Idiomarina abyssalis]